MAPTGETSPATASTQLEAESPARDLVGWTRQAEFRNTRRLSAEAMRKLLATALGLTTDVLAGLDTTQLRTALDRQRAMAGLTQKLAELASHDDLTGALRRSAGLSALQREIDRSRRVGGT